MDMILDGEAARVEVLQQYFENRIYLVVTLDVDPGREQRDERVLPGRRFFFFPEEVDPLDETSTREITKGAQKHQSQSELTLEQKFSARRILIACIGNSRRYPEGVHVIDFGIRGIDLAHDQIALFLSVANRSR